jgi:hypothetical protein
VDFDSLFLPSSHDLVSAKSERVPETPKDR